MDYMKLATLNNNLRDAPNPVIMNGKLYIDVAKRVQGFWQLYPNGRIITKWPELSDTLAVCIAEVYDGEILLTTGTAREEKGAGFVNKTSYVENAETSAVGRALGLLGIGSVDSIASSDEMRLAVAPKTPKETKNKNNKQVNTVRMAFMDICQRYGLNPGEQARGFGLNNQSTDEDFNAAIMMIESKYGG